MTVRVAIAGSTGSIGSQTLDVVRAEGCDRYEVVALGAGSSANALIEQAKEFHPVVVAVADAQARREVADALEPLGIEIVGDLAAVVDRADVVINGVVGFAGLPVTIGTLRAGKRLGLSNKESAERLHMSVDTERTHMMNILNKLGVHSRLQALLFAARHGLVELR